MIASVQKAHFPIHGLGYGKRIGIWFQGCSIRCAGCINRDTWPAQAGFGTTVESLYRSLGAWLDLADGLTISGGEPFDQAEAVSELVDMVRERLVGDILVYSGYSYDRLLLDYPELVEKLDVLITEPYNPQAGQSLFLRGSDNQRVFLLSPLARQRYPLDIDTRRWEGDRKMDIVVDGDNVWLAGIPKPGDMGRLRTELQERGFSSRGSDQFIS